MPTRSLALAAVAATLLSLGAAPAPLDPMPAAAPPRLEVAVGVLREVARTDAQGRAHTVLEPVTRTQPGDVLVYRLRARNVGVAPARDARLDDPIPQGTVLVPESVGSDRKVQASIDGGKTWQAFPASVAHRRADGAVVQVPAPPEAYTHLRWLLDGALPPGGSTEVAFKVRVR